jgi:glutaredoxin
MVMPEHICPFGLKARFLLRRKGYQVDDRWLKTRKQTDAFKAEQHVQTTPQVFIDGRRIGGYDDLRRHFGLTVRETGEASYRPVIAVFAVALLLAGARAQMRMRWWGQQRAARLRVADGERDDGGHGAVGARDHQAP